MWSQPVMVARQVVFHTTRVSLKMSMSRGSTVKQQGQTLHRNYVSNSLLWYIVIYHCCHFIRMFYPHECNRNTAQELAANEMLIPWIIVPAHLTLTLFPFFFSSSELNIVIAFTPDSSSFFLPTYLHGTCCHGISEKAAVSLLSHFFQRQPELSNPSAFLSLIIILNYIHYVSLSLCLSSTVRLRPCASAG